MSSRVSSRSNPSLSKKSATGAFVYAVHAPRSLVRVRIEERSGDYVGIYPPEVGPVYRGSVLCAYVEQTPERPEYRYEISRE